MRLAPKASRPLALAAAVVVVLAALAPTAFVLASGAVVGSIAHTTRDGWSSAAGHRLIWALGVLGIAFIAEQVLPHIIVACADSLGMRLNGMLRARVMTASFAPVGVGHLEDPEVADQVAMARGVGPGEFTPGSALAGMASIGSQRLSMVFAAVVVARYSIVLAVLLVVAAFVTTRIFRGEFVRSVAALTGQMQSLRKAHYFRDMAVGPAATKEIRTFGLHDMITTRFRTHWYAVMRDAWRSRTQGAPRSMVALVGSVAITGVAYALLARDLAHGAISAAAFTVYIQAVGTASNLSLNDNELRVEYGAAALPAVTALEAKVARVLRPEAVEPVRDQPQRSVRFEHVDFRYPNTTSDIFEGLDLDVEAGRSLAIVGVNGAGKTTLIKLLAGLYQPTAGRITVDGVDLRDLDPGGWQRRVAAIFQDFVHYEMSAADNIGFGAVEHLADRSLIVDAARAAGADEIVAALPNGFDTVLSRQYRDGTDLSGGQWQRLALARALMAVRAGAGILVLDEPTANLDVRAEAVLFDQFLELTRGCTTVLISHRFSTVRRADRICVLDGGRVIEAGSHDELVALGGRYAVMFNAQAARFADDAAEETLDA
jgi:ABC-type multidrug transport system fused ATPase/permease subunit